jgi:hypothetical protein
MYKIITITIRLPHHRCVCHSEWYYSNRCDPRVVGQLLWQFCIMIAGGLWHCIVGGLWIFTSANKEI